MIQGLTLCPPQLKEGSILLALEKPLSFVVTVYDPVSSVYAQFIPSLIKLTNVGHTPLFNDVPVHAFYDHAMRESKQWICHAHLNANAVASWSSSNSTKLSVQPGDT